MVGREPDRGEERSGAKETREFVNVGTVEGVSDRIFHFQRTAEITIKHAHTPNTWHTTPVIIIVLVIHLYSSCQISSVENMVDMACDAISGPTHQQQPQFKWSPNFDNVYHVGLPEVWDFDWQHIVSTD